MNTVSPHRFIPLRPWDRRAKGRCRACRLPRAAHPIRYWAPLRSIHDKSRAELTFKALSKR